MRFLVGIPTLKRYDLLDKCIESIWENTVKPERILVVDNGGGYVCANDKVHVVRPSKNLGVAASWNLLMKLADPLDIIIANDDVVFESKTALTAILEADADLVMGDKNSGFIAFKVKHEVWKNMPFDENFYPAYYEDNDYARRITLGGFNRKDVASGTRHAKSSTIAVFNGHERNEFNSQFEACKGYYIRKWGGLPGDERYLVPFGGSQTSGNDILKTRFALVCNQHSDISEHCQTLCDLAAECNHVTEFDTGTGNSTVAMMYAKPKHLVCYSLQKPRIITELNTIKDETNLVLIEKSTLEVEIDPTDMLFIDSKHTYNQLSSELRLHADKVSKYIVIHDTVAFGQRGEDGGRGIMPAINDFLQLKTFKIKNHYKNNNGLIVLERGTPEEVQELIQPAPSLMQLYKEAKNTPSDIWEHIGTIFKYASLCNHITEFGTRLGMSTRALMLSRPARLITYDTYRQAQVDLYERAAKEAGLDFTFKNEDVTKIEIEETDLLFIDTWHTYTQMKTELAMHAHKVRKYLMFHDVETFCFDGEGGGDKGLWWAISEYVKTHPEWTLCYLTSANNGLAVLSRT